MNVLLILVITSSLLSTLQADFIDNIDNPIVSTSSGRIRGVPLRSSLKRKFYAYRGIRYAKPPIDGLRFKAPEPVEPWIETFDATQDGPQCPQPNDLSSGSEDCLRLNIYTHSPPSGGNNESSGLPVIVYLHLGAFYSHSGLSSIAGPQYFMDRDIVLVTLNYRLGLLGFLSLGTAAAPGNAGLKDQVMAMKWIKENIVNFGGDPDSVTLLGYGSGAQSITLHLISPMSKGFFGKAIVINGSGISQKPMPKDQINVARRQARNLGCTEESLNDLFDCLMTKDTMTLVKSMSFQESVDGHMIFFYKPVLEPDFGQERFLIEDPTVLYQRGEFMKIPIITGITKDQFLGPAFDDLSRKQLISEFDKLAPILFNYAGDNNRSEEISFKLRQFYLGSQILQSEQSIKGLNDLFDDALINFPNHRFTDLAAHWTKVYYYHLSFQGRFSSSTDVHGKPYGVTHYDNLLYLFVIPFFAPFANHDREKKMVERFTRMLTNFATRGDPNDPTDEYLKDLAWKPYCIEDEKYLDMGDELIMKDHLYSNRFSIWNELFPLVETVSSESISEESNEEEGESAVSESQEGFEWKIL